MEYKKIIFNQTPVITHAHNYTTDSYNPVFSIAENYLDITYIDAGELFVNFDKNGERIIPIHSIFCTPRNCKITLRCEAPLHRHSTVGVLSAYEVVSLSKTDIKEYSRTDSNRERDGRFFVIFPNYVPINQSNEIIVKQIQNIILSHSVFTYGRDLHCTGLLFELLSSITSHSIRSALIDQGQNIPPSSTVYVNRAIHFISTHLDSDISIQDIADFLGISSGYLAIIFKAITSQKVTEYINRSKIDLVKELVINKNVTLKEAGEAVDILDPNYLSRLFRRYTGVNAREYKLLQYKEQV